MRFTLRCSRERDEVISGMTHLDQGGGALGYQRIKMVSNIEPVSVDGAPGAYRTSQIGERNARNLMDKRASNDPGNST